MKVLKTILLVIGAFVLAVVVAFVVAGILIPAGQSFENETEINAPAEKVWEVITDKKRYTEWQTAIDRVEVIDEKIWIEYPKGSPEPLRFSLANDERPQRMEFHYAMGDSFSGHWKGEITPTATGVKLKTSDSYTTKGWLTKIMIYTFFDLGSFAKDWNQKLKTRVEELNK